MIRQPHSILASLLLLAAAVFPVLTVAQDTPDSVLERIRIQETRHFSYRETRILKLLEEPWLATGDMYISPQQMVIARQSPTPVFTVITADRMQHIDAGQNIDRSLKLEHPFAVPGMEPFMQLLYRPTGDTEQERYDVNSFETAGQRWSLQLAPRQNTADGIIRIELSGDSGLGPDRMVLEHADGDRTEWQLSLQSQGEAAGRKMQQLLESIHQAP
jgi:hypothetical protein